MTTHKTLAVVLGIALFTNACENLTPGENAGLFGAATGLAVGIPLVAAGVDPSIVIPVTAGAVAIAAVGAYVIAKHQATERQRQIAEQRARLYIARQKELQAKTPTRAKKSRFIAVKTDKSEASKGQAAVMIFDTQTNQIVGNNVYDVKKTPQVGETAKFDTYSAQYVGNGN